jgi:hypothetical protein
MSKIGLVEQFYEPVGDVSLISANFSHVSDEDGSEVLTNGSIIGIAHHSFH